MVAGDGLVLAASAIIWLSGLMAMRSTAARALAIVLAILGAVVLHNQYGLTAQSFRVALWSVLAVAAIVQVYTAARQRERNVGGYVLLLSALLLVAVSAESAIGQLLSLLIGVCASFLLAALATLAKSRLRGAQRRKVLQGRRRMIEESHRRLALLPGDARHEFATGIVDLVEAAPLQFLTVAWLGQKLGQPWPDVWVVAAELEEQHLVALSDHGLSPDAAVALVGDKDRGTSFRSLNLIKFATFGEGSSIVAGDSNTVSAGTFTGAIGRNKVRDITSSNSGDQSQKITQDDIVTQTRELAATVDSPQSTDLREAADNIEKAKEPKDLRRAVTTVIGIAAAIGEHGSALLELGKKFLDGLTS